MSPRHSDYRSEEFDFEQDDTLSYRRLGDESETRRTPRPTNRPARHRKARVVHNGIQRRRNKHWSW